MKKIDRLILKVFLGPFFLSLSVVVFIFLVQYLVKYFPELVGKGLSWTVFAELLLYFSISVTPNSLPLAILISTLMSYGNLGEHFELSAIKSAGISLIRILIPTFVFAIFLCIAAFFLNNNIVPYANLKAFSLLYDVRQKKPTLDFQEGTFYNGIPGYSIKINKKYEDGKSMKDIIIYNHTQGRGNIEIIISDSAQMYTIMQDRYLVMKLYNGNSYSELIENQNINKQQFVRSKFTTSQILFNLESFSLQRTQEDLFKSNKIMRNISQLQDDVDSLNRLQDTIRKEVGKNIKPMYNFANRLDTSFQKQSATFVSIAPKTPRDTNSRLSCLEYATNSARNIKSYLGTQRDRLSFYNRDINGSYIELIRKFSLSFACLVMFLIGAPLGAIIKKGGLGVPILISIVFFIVYYVISIIAEKWARDGYINVYLAMWSTNILYLPIGMFFLKQAKNDSRLLEIDNFAVLFDNLKRKFNKKLNINVFFTKFANSKKQLDKDVFIS